MKRTLVNVTAVLVALITGLAINNACAEKIDSENPEEAPMTARFFVEDGLLFGPDGKVYNKLKSYSGSGRYDELQFDNNSSELCKYDSKGRLMSRTYYDSVQQINASYSYSGLTVIEKISGSNGEGDWTVSNTYTYHSLEQ